MSKDPGAIIQFGSGHPGEEGSGHFESVLFDELGMENPNILFIPFHSMPPDSGDMARFQQLQGAKTSGWIKCVQLEPPRWPINTAEIFTLIEEAQLIVMGSGFPEPFSRLMFRIGLPQRLRKLQQRGVHFMGYSAGSLTLSEGYYLPFTGEDLLIQLSLLDHISMPDAKRTEMEDQMMAPIEREDAREFVDALRAKLDAKQELDDDQRTFMEEPLWMEQAKGFQMTPGLTANPHYGEQFQYREVHLKHLASMYPHLTHVGLPNGTALVSRGPEGQREIKFRGHNPRRQAAWRKGDGDLVHLHDGDTIQA